MSKSNIVSSVQSSQESIDKLQALFKELYQGAIADNATDFLTQTAIQNFILSFQELAGKEGEILDSETQTKQILSQIELNFLDHLRQKKGLGEQNNSHLSNQEIMNRNEVHKEILALLRSEVKEKIEEYSGEISIIVPYRNKIKKGDKTFNHIFKAQEIYKYSSDGIKQLTKALIEESKKDLENVGIVLRADIKYVISCFGSLARDEASPYSDLEFGVLLEDGIEDKLSAEKLEEVKEFFRNLSDLLNIKVINLGETTAIIQDIKEVKDLALKLPTKNGFSFDGNALGGCKTPLGNKRAIIKRIEEINKDSLKGIEFINSNNSLSQTQKNERISEISESTNKRISKLKEDEFELIMTSSQMAEFHNKDCYQRDRHLSTTLFTADVLQASSQEDAINLLESYRKKTNELLDEEVDNELTLRKQRALNLLSESVGKFEPRAGRNQDKGKSFSPKYDFYRPATMLIDHLSYFYNIGNKEGERSVWERFEKLFVRSDNLQNTPLPLASENNSNIEGITNLRWMLDRTLEIRLKNYMAEGDQNENMVFLDDHNEEGKIKLQQKGSGITQNEVFEVYYAMMPFYNDVISFNESKGNNIGKFTERLYCDDNSFRKAQIHNLFRNYEKSSQYYVQALSEYVVQSQESAAILHNLSVNYGSLGKYNKEIELLSKSLEICKEIFGEKHPGVAASLNNLGSAYGSMGNYEKKIELLNQSLEINKEIFGEKHPNVATNLNNLATSYILLGDDNKAIKLLNQSLEITKEIFGEKYPDVAFILSNLGASYGKLGNQKKKIELLDQSLEITKEIFGEKHPDVIGDLNNLGEAYGELGNQKKKIELLDQSLEITKEISGEKHPDAALILNNLGIAYGKLGNYNKEIELLNQSLKIQKEVFGEKHPDVAASLNNLGNAYGELGNYNKKIELVHQSLEIIKETFGEKHPDVAVRLNNLGNAYGKREDHKKKIELLHQSLEITKEIFGENHVNFAASLSNLGDAYGSLGDYQKQIELLNKSLEIIKETLGEKHPDVAIILNNLGTTYGELGKYNKEIELLNQSLKIQKEVFGEKHPNIAINLNNLGNSYGKLENYNKKIELLNQSLKMQKEIFGEKHPNVAASLNNLGNAYGSLGDYHKQIELLNKSLKITKKIFGERHTNIASNLNNLGNAYGLMGNYEKKIALLKQSLEITKEILGEKHPHIGIILSNLGDAYKLSRRYYESLKSFKESLGIFLNFYPKEHPNVQIAEKNCSLLQQYLGITDKISTTNPTSSLMPTTSNLHKTAQYQISRCEAAMEEIRKNKDKIKIIPNKNEQNKETENPTITIEVESDFLKKDLRDRLGLFRSRITNINNARLRELKSSFPTATMEKEYENGKVKSSILFTADRDLKDQVQLVTDSWKNTNLNQEKLKSNKSDQNEQSNPVVAVEAPTAIKLTQKNTTSKLSEDGLVSLS